MFSAVIAAALCLAQDVNAAQGDGMTALHWAAYQEDTKLIAALLAKGARVDAATRNGALTPIFLAATSGNAQSLKLLLDAGAPVDSRNEHGATPLMFAAASGNVDALQILVERGAAVNAADTARGQSALFYAAALNRADAVRFLLKSGADAGFTTKVRVLERLRMDMDGNVTPVKDDAKPAATAPAGRAGDIANFSPRETGTTKVGGATALLIAARDGHRATIEALLEGGANINQASAADKSTALITAIINGHVDLAHFLLSKGADPKLVNDAGLGPLFALIDVRWVPKAWYPQPDITTQDTEYIVLLRELITKGADVNARLEKKLWFRGLSQDPTWADSKGATPFWRAAQSVDVPAMKLLLAHGADPLIATAANVTPLMVAAGIGWMANHSTVAPDSWLEAVKLCVETAGAKKKDYVQQADSRGYTALHGAGYIGHNDMVNFLVDQGAKVDVKTKAGDSPADMANGPTRFGLPHPETLALLEKLGSPNSQNCRSDQCLVAPKADPPKTETKR